MDGRWAAPPAPAGAQVDGNHERGPDPTSSTLLSNDPFATTQTNNVSGGFGSGFNNVNICYPNDTSQGTFAGVVVVPGFIAPKSLMMWSCQKFASHGFVVAVMEPNSVLDFPGPRADQAQGIIRYLSGSGAPAAVQQRLDTDRWGIMGHSMGGGALIAGREDNPAVGAVVALQPFDPAANNSGTQTPTMIIGASNDLIANPATSARPYYNQISWQRSTTSSCRARATWWASPTTRSSRRGASPGSSGGSTTTAATTSSFARRAPVAGSPRPRAPARSEPGVS